MMKKLTALLLALTMLLSMTTAFAWSCPSCGSDNGGKFCTECGTKKPEDVICPSCGTNYGDAAPKFCMECGTKLGEAAVPTAAPTATPAPAEEEPAFYFYLHEGRVYVLWDADGTTEYRVHYFPKHHDDVRLDMTEANLAFERESTNSMGILGCSAMVPGEAYWVGVFDAEGKGEYIPYIPQEEVEAFTACEIEMLALPTLRGGDSDVRVEAFSDFVLNNAGEGNVGLYLALLYENLPEAMEVCLQVVFTCPNGLKYVSTAADGELKADVEDAIGWAFYDLADDLAVLRQAFGEIPVGEYTASIYLNGQYAASAAFEVSASNIFVINGFAPNGDGTATVAWTGGTAPYDVQYCIRTSENIEDDSEYAAENGFLQTAETGLEATGTTLYELIPGEKYWVIVKDAQGERAYKAVKTLGGEFADFATELVLSSNPVDADKTNVATDYKNGVYMGFVYENPGEARQVLLLCTVDYGNGRKKVTEAGRFVMQSGKNCFDMGSYASMDALLEELAANTNFELEEDVTLSIYLDGKLAGQVVVPVEKEEALGITGIKSNGNGTVALTWKGGKAPYNVRYHVKRSEDYQADLTNPNGTGRWMAADKLTDTSYTLTDLVPGVSYWLTVFDAAGAGWYAPYIVSPAPQSVPGLTASLEVVPKACVGENVTEIDVFPVAAVGVEDDTEYGASIILQYENAGEERSAFFQLVYTLPGGATMCNYDSEVTLYSGSHWIGWESFRSMENFLSYLRGMWGGFNEGDFKVDVYLDGCLAGSAVIPVGQPAPQRNSGVEIAGIVENADGTATITWTDEFGRAPYEIDYVQKFTDDYEADRNTGTGYWYDTKEATGGSYTLRYLTPGQAYWVAVYDANGYGQFISYEPAAAQAFPEFTMKMELTPVWRLGSDMKVSEFSSAEIGLGTSEHGLELWIRHPQLARTRNYLGVISITSPDGSRVSVSTSDWQLDRGEAKSVGWRFFDLDWYFGIMTDSFGAVPVGTYTVEFFCDGELACSSSFRVTE